MRAICQRSTVCTVITWAAMICAALPVPTFAEVAQWDFDGDLLATTEHAPLEAEFAAPAFEAIWDFEDATIGERDAGVASWTAGTMFRAPLNFAPNGGGNLVNEYTVILDVFYPAGTEGWQCLLQTNEANTDDADWCVNAVNGIGISGNYGGLVRDGDWNRVALVVDLPAGTYTSFVNGEQVQQNTGLSVDDRFALGATVMFFGDENGETAGGLIDSIQVRDEALCPDDLAAIGSPFDAELDPSFEADAECEVDPGEFRILHGPYLQWSTQNAITVMWETSVESDSTLHYRRGDDWLELHDAELVRIHEVRLEGLDPKERVEYSVRSRSGEEEVTSEIWEFETAPPAGEPFRFTVWWDSQDNPGVFGNLVDDMVTKEPAIAVSVGDVVGTGSVFAQWGQQLLAPIWPLARTVPFWVAIGNHEQQSHWFDDYLAHPGNEHWFSFDYSGCHFVVLDTNRPFAPGTEQYRWLVDELFSDAAQESDWLFTFHHHPPFSEIHEEARYAQLREWIVPVYEEAGVDINFTGHIHDYERGVFVPPETGRRIAYVQTSGGGGRLWDDEFDGEYDEIEVVIQYVYHYCALDVSAKRLTLRAIDLDGLVIDSFSLDAMPRDGERPEVPPVHEPGESATQWDFVESDMSASYGPGEMRFVGGEDGPTSQNVEFGTTETFGIADIDGVVADVMRFPRAETSEIGFIVEHGAPANFGAFVNEYTMVFDLYIPTDSFLVDGWLGLFNTNATNSNDGDLFVRLADGGLGISGQYEGAIVPDTWHRVSVTFEVEGATVTMKKYIDGAFVGTQSAGSVDGRWSIYSNLDATPWFFLLTDDSGDATGGFISSYFFADRPLSASDIEALGGADADGILHDSCEPDCEPKLFFVRGDANADGSTDISDAVAVLRFLFVGDDDSTPCLKAGDSDDSGRLDLTDAVFLLDYLFRGGRQLPSPSIECGEDPSDDELDCDAYSPCEI